MMLRARILLVISISSLILYIPVDGLHILSSIAQPDSKLDEANRLQKGKGARGLDKRKDAPEPALIPTPSPLPIPFLGPVPNPNIPLSPGLSPGPGPYPGSGMAPASSPEPIPDPGLPLSPGLSPGLAPSLGPGVGPSLPGSAPGPSPPGFIDHDLALAIEARIKQSQSDAKLAMDKAKKLLKDPNIASSETGMCLNKCVGKYGASLNELDRAIKDLGVRDVTLLADDFGAVETDISTCQACFTENIGEDSPLKELEEATTKAARECLNVMDYAA